MAETTLLSEIARVREAPAMARDRLMTTLFLVGALHALLILGVTFTGTVGGASRESPTLEVVLVRNPVADERTNSSADYLAQVNQRGAGTDPEARHAESPHTPPQDPGAEGAAAADGSQGAATGADSEAELLASRARSSDKHYFARTGPSVQAGAPLVFEPPAPEYAGADAGEELRLAGHAERELMVSANTRESSVAVYVDGWRRKIEHIGAANYPLEAARRAGLSGSPVLEVQILADGTLGGAFIRRSSGHPELDRAALAILRLGSPFEPFPRSLAAQHDALRLTYEWQFLGGELNNSSVRMPSDTR